MKLKTKPDKGVNKLIYSSNYAITYRIKAPTRSSESQIKLCLKARSNIYVNAAMYFTEES